MKVKVTKELFDAVGSKKMAFFGLSADDYRWGRGAEIDLTRYSVKTLKELADAVKACTGVRGNTVVHKDIQTWIRAIDDPESVKARTCQHFYALLKEVMLKVEGHRIYIKDDNRDVWLAYYVGAIEYQPKQVSRDGVVPPYIKMKLYWQEFGKFCGEVMRIEERDCRNMRVLEVLAKEGIALETEELRKAYLAQRDVYVECCDKVGRQYLASGMATDDLDGNSDDEDRYWYHTNSIFLDKDGSPARVVIDVFRETDKKERSDDNRPTRWFWAKAKSESDDQQEESSLAEVEDVPEPEVPYHLMVACYDLRRHLRIRVHVGQLKLYEYDESLGDKLVLPADSLALVNVLMSFKSGFKDIISGKAGGAVIICAGPPGTGKTLTAEVYAEVAKRPLYSVQCSQLGMTAEELEAELLRCFSRSQRWNAILLLDEADVYVAKRGTSIQQNAIVGVFLRVLEYYSGVLFLTTNRAESIDDAVSSRAVAKITYTKPPAEDQKKIWAILSKASDIKLSTDLIDKIVAKFPDLSGRDIKNLLKLAMYVSKANGNEVSLETIEMVKKFKPTNESLDA